jgi:ADP-heptose:LPS heptosyltransferase
MDRKQVRAVLLIELTRLGDVLAMLGSVETARSHWPGAAIHLFVDSRYRSLVEALAPGVTVHGIAASATGRGFWRAVFAARRLKVDLACSLSPGKRNAALALASGAKAVAGYFSNVNVHIPYLVRTPVEAYGIGLEQAETYGREHIGLRAAKVLRALGARQDEPGSPGRSGWEFFAARQEELRPRLPERDYVAIHPLAYWKFKQWGMRRFGALAEKIVTGLHLDVVFLCAPEESSQLDGLREELGHNRSVHFFAAKDLVEAGAVIKGAAAFVGNDSGPLHLAACLDVAVVGLYGPAEPSLVAPLGARGAFLYGATPCSPCAQRICVQPEDHCLSRIGVEQVVAALAQIVGKPSSRPSPCLA